MVDKYDRMVEDSLRSTGGQAAPASSETNIWDPLRLMEFYHNYKLADENVLAACRGNIHTVDLVIEGI